MTSPYRSSFDSAALSPQAADEARERAIRLLTDAYAYDVITDVEFERRLGELGNARTRGMIDAVVSDLPTVPGTAMQQPLYAPVANSEGRITGFMSSLRRKGPWRVPQHLTVRALMCDMKIDLRYTAIPASCSIEVSALMSAVAIIVAPGTIVDFNVDPMLGSANSGAEAGFPGGSPHIHVHGSAVMSDVQVKVRKLGR